MDMEMPVAEELEWLENNALLPEEEDDRHYHYVEADHSNPSEKFPSKFAVADPHCTGADPFAAADTLGNRKRLRSSDYGDEEVEALEERGAAAKSKRRVSEEEDSDDNDWLRYSPPPKDHSVAEADAQLPEVIEKTISRFASEIEGDCMPVTGPNGERVYAKLRSAEIMGGGCLRKLAAETPPKGLLLESFDLLSKRAEQEALAKALQESFGSEGQQACPAIPVVNEQLWVEKYAPNSFTELLSDEHTNREVLLWLKQWDSCVFGSHVRSTSDDVLSALRRHSSIIRKHSHNNNFFVKNMGASIEGQDHKPSNAPERENDNLKSLNSSLNRRSSVNNTPEQKVLLLCGPPGLGKTTLAHVAAKHCGYRVVEINASDDRSASSIESKILDVIQMNSVMSDSKPKCLVIDEIDGALSDGKGAVEVILKMVAAEKNNNSDKGNGAGEAQTQKASSRKGHKAAKLSRPVICICNDLYAPALRQLRQVAKVHMFVQPTVSRVVNRLKYICKKEGFKTSTIALSVLAEYTECDIRSCLNTLQFLNKKREALNILEVDSQVVGRKDMSKSILDVWKQVFQKKKLKRGGKAVSHCSRHDDTDSLYSLISNRGEYEITMDGIHENFLRLSYHDPMMQKTVKCFDMLGISDSLLQYVFRTQQMSLYSYEPPIIIAMSHLIAQVEKPNIEWPKASQRCRTILWERKDMLKTWQNRMSPSISRHLSIESFVKDIASLFLHVLSPPNLRPVALHLLSEREKDELAQLVDTMVSYAVTYKNAKPEPTEKTNGFVMSPDVAPLSLDPPVGDLIKFKGYQSEHFGISLAMKQVLVHEVEKQKIIQDSVGKSLNITNDGYTKNGVSITTNGRVAAMNISTSESSGDSCKHNSAILQMRKTAKAASNSASCLSSKDPRPMKKPNGHPSKFFDWFRKRSTMDAKTHTDAVQKAATIDRDMRPLIFKYNEGFTNAVKRPVKVRDLLL